MNLRRPEPSDLQSDAFDRFATSPGAGQDPLHPSLALALAGEFFGAGDGNRTRVSSLEGWHSTIELPPPKRARNMAKPTDQVPECATGLGAEKEYRKSTFKMPQKNGLGRGQKGLFLGSQS